MTTVHFEWDELLVEAEVDYEAETGPTYSCGGTPESWEVRITKLSVRSEPTGGHVIDLPQWLQDEIVAKHDEALNEAAIEAYRAD